MTGPDYETLSSHSDLGVADLQDDAIGGDTE